MRWVLISQTSCESAITQFSGREVRHLPSTGVFPEMDFFQRVSALPAPRILEIGSRKVTGGRMPRERAGPAATFVGLDILAGANVDVVGDAHELSRLFPPHSFDAAYSAAVFEHLAMPWKVALELNRVLRTGGLAYIASHHSFAVHEMPWDFWRYGRDAFQTIFSEATGYRVLNHSLIWSANLCAADASTQRPDREGGHAAREGWHAATGGSTRNGEGGHAATGGSTRNGEVRRVSDACFFFADIFVEKIGEPDESRFRWNLSLDSILPKAHFYPSGTGLSASDAGRLSLWRRAIRKGGRVAGRLLARVPGGERWRFERGVGRGSWRRLFDRFQNQLRANGAARVLVITGGEVAPEMRPFIAGARVVQYATAEQARQFYSLPEQLGCAFDAVVVDGALGLLEYPWLAAPVLARLLKEGGGAFVKEAQVAPLRTAPDLWRFSSEALRVIFNPVVGFEVEQAVMDEPLLLVPDDLKNPVLGVFDCSKPVYGVAACLLKRTPVALPADLRWGWLGTVDKPRS